MTSGWYIIPNKVRDSYFNKSFTRFKDVNTFSKK